MKTVKTNDGKVGAVMRECSGVVTVRFNNGRMKDYRSNQVEVIENSYSRPDVGISAHRKKQLISKYEAMLEECRNEGARVALLGIVNDLKQ